MKEIGSKIRMLRMERHLSLRDLSRRADVAFGYLSKVERGQASPTVIILQKILNALNLGIFDFFQDEMDTDATERVVYPKSAMVVSEDEDRTWYFAFPGHQERQMELTYEEYRPHTKVIERESFKGDICGIVLSGALTIEIVNQGVFEAKAGDAFYIKADKLHAGRNDGDEVLKIVAVQRLPIPAGPR